MVRVCKMSRDCTGLGPQRAELAVAEQRDTDAAALADELHERIERLEEDKQSLRSEKAQVRIVIFSSFFSASCPFPFWKHVGRFRG